MCQESFPLRPASMLHFRQGRIYGTHGSLCPLLPALLIHLVFEYRLYQPMHRKQGASITADLSAYQGVRTQHLNGLIQQVRVCTNRSKLLAKMLSAFGDDSFGDSIRSKKDTQVYEIGSGRVSTLNTLERKRPGGSHGHRVIVD